MVALHPVAIVPAAGSAERFGGAKLLADVDGRPLLERTIASLLEGGVEEVAVVLGPDATRVREGVPLLADGRVRSAVNPDPRRGMLSSIQVGLALVEGEPILVLPGDMPFVRSGTVGRLLDVYRAKPAIVSPRLDGKRGHPIVIPTRFRLEIVRAESTSNLHVVLAPFTDDRLDVDVDDRGIVRDVDRPEDLW